jgi:hypothetical protein
MRFSLTIADGQGAGQRFELARSCVSIGRDDTSDVVLHSSTVSRSHAVIRLQRGRWVVADGGSANGTLLNGRPVSAPSPLNDGDRLVFGAVVCRFGRAGRPWLWPLAVAGATALALICVRQLSPRAGGGTGPLAPSSARDAEEPRAGAPLEAPDPGKAQRAYELGKRRLAERRIAPRNLFDAWSAFSEAEARLASMPAPPPLHAEAERLSRFCAGELEKECRRLLFVAARHERYGEAEQAQRTYREILLHFPGDDATGCRKKAQDKVAPTQVEVTQR